MSSKGRAIVASKPGENHKGGENWEIQDITVTDELKDGEVMVDMVASGICHTDLLLTSFPPEAVTYPRIAGHEGAGYVKAIGPNVTRDIKVGDPVLLSFDYCQSCENCKANRLAYCDTFSPLNLFGSDGTFNTSDGNPVAGKFFGQSSFASVSTVNQSSILPVKQYIKEKDDLKLFAPLGCGIQTGAGAILNLAKPVKADRVMVLGLGGVGLSAVMGAKIAGAGQIIAVDRVKSRIDLAKQFGATDGLDTSGVDDMTESFKEVTKGAGPTIIVDTTSVVKIIKAAYDSIAISGTFIVIGGGMSPDYKIDIDIVTHVMKGIKLYGCVEGNSVPTEFIPKLIEYYREGKLPIDKISKFYKADEFKEAVHAMHTGETIKPIIMWQ